MQEQPSHMSKVDVPLPKFFKFIFFGIIAVAFIYIGTQLFADLSHLPQMALFSFVLLAAALFIALGFEFVNGFHDTANAIATSVSTRALHPSHAIIMAAVLNFAGAMYSTGVAKTIGAD